MRTGGVGEGGGIGVTAAAPVGHEGFVEQPAVFHVDDVKPFLCGRLAEIHEYENLLFSGIYPFVAGKRFVECGVRYLSLHARGFVQGLVEVACGTFRRCGYGTVGRYLARRAEEQAPRYCRNR